MWILIKIKDNQKKLNCQLEETFITVNFEFEDWVAFSRKSNEIEALGWEKPGRDERIPTDEFHQKRCFVETRSWDHKI